LKNGKFLNETYQTIVIVKLAAKAEDSRQLAKKKKGKGEEIKITKYKSQITNKLQSQNYKLQTKEVPFGHIVYAFGER
jgi:hypothetical protein